MNQLPQPQVLLSADRIKERLITLAGEINQHYAGKEILLVSILDGALIFTADLLRLLNLPTQLDCMRISSYGNSTSAESAPRITGSLKSDLSGRDVLLVDDILDTGNTLSELIEHLGQSKPASLRTCVLLDKKERRQLNIQADHVGFNVPDAFVVGYGLDFAERYRSLPCIGVLKPEFQKESYFQRGC